MEETIEALWLQLHDHIKQYRYTKFILYNIKVTLWVSVFLLQKILQIANSVWLFNYFGGGYLYPANPLNKILILSLGGGSTLLSYFPSCGLSCKNRWIVTLKQTLLFLQLQLWLNISCWSVLKSKIRYNTPRRITKLTLKKKL